MDNRDIMSLGVYIHLPYCITKCPYCDFNSYGIQGEFPEDRYVSALLSEIDHYGSLISQRGIETIFFGGGTPSIFNTDNIGRIVSKLNTYSTLNDKIEISLEVNPNTADKQKLAELKSLGVNRISVGVQSFDEKKLKFYGRINDPYDSENILNEIREVGFKNFNLDLIYGSCEDSIDELKDDLEKSLCFEPNHISAYCLTIEDGTEFAKLFKRGELHLPNEELLIDYMVFTSEFLESKGYVNYEISNFAKPGFECKHNLIYWTSDSYLGVGAGAHTHIVRNEGDIYSSRWSNIRSPKHYMNKIEENISHVVDKFDLSRDSALEDKLLMGLRLKEGISLKKIENDFNKVINIDEVSYLVDDDFIQIDGINLKLTDKGKLYTNNLIPLVLKSFNSSQENSDNTSYHYW